MPFINTWNYIQNNLIADMSIKNWTVDHGFLGDQFKISSKKGLKIIVNSPNAKNTQNVPQHDFEMVYHIWGKYIAGNYSRSQIQNNTYYSKYIISILKWVEGGNGGTLP